MKEDTSDKFQHYVQKMGLKHILPLERLTCLLVPQQIRSSPEHRNLTVYQKLEILKLITSTSESC